MSSTRSFRWILVSWKTTISASRISNIAYKLQLKVPSTSFRNGLFTAKVRLSRHGWYPKGLLGGWLQQRFLLEIVASNNGWVEKSFNGGITDRMPFTVASCQSREMWYPVRDWIEDPTVPGGDTNHRRGQNFLRFIAQVV